MGLFKRKDAAPDSQTGKPRPSVSSEAQAAELRARARRRLAGAIALVLAAVIILPMVLDSEPARVSDDIPIRVPDRNTPYQPAVSDPQQAPATPGGDAGSSAGNQASGAQTPATPATAVPAQGANGSVAPATPAVPSPANGGQASAAQQKPPPNSRPETGKPDTVRPEAARTENRPAENKPENKPETHAESKPPARVGETQSRSDDGARAMALLEGRAVPPATPAKPASQPPADAKGNFVLQIAAYTTQADAQVRRDKLHAAGVTNAFVQETSVGGKQQYRLRVGPFPSRDAAQAAQARLRTLGYDNGFIAAQ